MKRFQVRMGNDFEIDAFDIDPGCGLEPILEAKTKQDRERARRRVAYSLLAFIGAALASAAGVGLWRGDLAALHATWDALSLPLGSVLAFYFTGRDV